MEDHTEQPQGAFVAKMLADIERVGWTAIGVFDPEGDEPPFTYTIGLGVSYNHPELITFGLPPEVAHGVIATAIEQIKAGVDFTTQLDTDVSNIISDDFTCRFLSMSESQAQEFMLQAINFYQMIEASDRFASLQLVWPDENNQYPWQDECNPGIAMAQPLVGAREE